jgi:hypothetical protein
LIGLTRLLGCFLEVLDQKLIQNGFLGEDNREPHISDHTSSLILGIPDDMLFAEMDNASFFFPQIEQTTCRPSY